MVSAKSKSNAARRAKGLNEGGRGNVTPLAVREQAGRACNAGRQKGAARKDPAGQPVALKPPASLSKEERAAFRRIASSAHWLTAADQMALELAARAMVQHETLIRRHAKAATDGEVKDLIALDRAVVATARELRAMLTELSLTPRARARMAKPEVKLDPDEFGL